MLKEIEQSIDRSINNSQNGVFVRMSSRSPKDSAFSNAKMRELLRIELQNTQSG